MPNIYVLDDEPSIGIILKLNLSDKYEVFTGLSINDFKANNQKIDGLILDLNIGADNGMQVLDTIRQGKYTNINNEIPVIVLSAEEDTKTKIECLEAGADDFMVKPFNPKELKARLNRMLNRINAMRNNG